MHDPKVSVLMPSYNRADLLPESIASVLAQTYTDLELIVIDDGSTDHTSAVLNTIQDKRLHTIRQPNRGISAALNRGLAAARGEIIARNDSDDVWRPELLATLVPVLAEHPDTALVYGRAQGIGNEGRPLAQLRGFPLRLPQQPAASLLFGDSTCSITTLMRSTHLRRLGGWDENISPNEDWDIALRMACRHRIIFVNRIVAHFRIHGGNTTGVKSDNLEAQLSLRRQILRNAFASPDLPPEAHVHKAPAYFNLYLGEGHTWLGSGEFRRASRAYCAALQAGEMRVSSFGRLLWSFCNWFIITRIPGGTKTAYYLLNLWRSAFPRYE